MCSKALLVTIIFIPILFLCDSSVPIGNIRNEMLMKRKFYIPVSSGAPYYRASVAPPKANNVCMQGVCVPFFLCVNGNVETTGANVLVPRLASEDGSNGPRYCGKTERCCKLSYDKQNSSVFDDNDTNSSYETHPMTIPVHSVNDNMQNTHDSFPECGIRNFNGLRSRISGEIQTEINEFPWMVVVSTKLPQTQHYNYKCGGSLLHPSVVLTAAHCVHEVEPNTLFVRAGEWNTANTDEPLPHQDRDIKFVINHRDFDKSSLVNDISILIMQRPFKLAENVDTICLPPPNHSFNNQRCIVTGWGKNEHGNAGRFQSILKMVELPIIPTRKCEMLMKRTFLGKYFRLHKSFLCAGAEYGRDSCEGDGGSPLVCRMSETSNSYYQAGIVSWGIKCNEANVPGAYVNVAKFRDWIDEAMRRMNIQNDSYIHP